LCPSRSNISKQFQTKPKIGWEQDQNRIFLTRDRDFGNLVFVKGLGAGVLYLRILPSNQKSVQSELERVLKTYSEDELKNAFVVIEAGGHRFRKPLN
jgi:predicted nuclease of predicted toxin-antitoxin system